MIVFQNVTFAYKDQLILKEQHLHIPPGGRAAFMGPSGCGKTTLLRLAAGLLRPRSGSVRVGAKKISCLFQEPRLFPGRTALENVNAVLSDRPGTIETARMWLEAVHLGEAADKYPGDLSGGMQQRVSLARALAYAGEILLLDEPMQGLDEARKEEMRKLILRHTAGKTILLVTHDQKEAEALADTIYVYEKDRFIPR